MFKLFGTYAVGIAIGVSIMLVLQSPIISPGKTIEAASSTKASELPGPDALSQTVTTQHAADTVNSGPAAEAMGAAVADDASSGDSPVRIPSVYRDLVGPIPAPRISQAEQLERFEKEPRDESWAFAMETGINDHIAKFGVGDGRVVEYVECRSKQCWIAGVKDEGHQGSSGRPLNDMRRSGWWQGEGGGHQIETNWNGLHLFILIYNRYAE